MKRIIAFALAVMLVLTVTACGKKEAEPTTEPAVETTVPVETTQATEETEAPAPTEPEWETGISRAGYGEAVYTLLEKGSEVKVIGQFKDYFVIEGEELDLLVEQRFVRLDSEDPFESGDGYSKSGTQVFEGVYMRDDAIATLSRNTKVTVLEGKGDWLYIEWAEGSGYVDADQISKWYINDTTTSDTKKDSSSGTTTTPADGSDVPLGSLAAQDFQAELTLLGDYYGPEMEKDSQEGMGVVLAEDVEAYICLLIRDDEAKVTEYDDETVTIYLEKELYAKLPRWLLRLEGDKEYESWTGYSTWSGEVYEEYQMRNERMKLTYNKEVKVLDKLPDCYVVEVDGQIGYMELGDISATKYGTGGSGSGSGSPSGSGSGSGSSSTGDTWTPPKM